MQDQTLASKYSTPLAAIQSTAECIQRVMRSQGGSFLQFRCDEKGFLSVCAFGLAGRSHEDGAARGIAASLSIVEALKASGGVRASRLVCL